MLSKLNRVAGRLGYPDAAAVPRADLRFQHVAAVRAKLQEERLSAATVNTVLAALKGVARAAFNLGQLSGDDHERIRAVKPVRGEKLLTGRALTGEEVSALLRVCVRTGGAGSGRWGSARRRFNPRPREGATVEHHAALCTLLAFQSTPPRGGRLGVLKLHIQPHDVSIHAPARGAT